MTKRPTSTLARRATAEFLGTAFLAAAVIGSGIMAERLSGGNTALALLANTLATAAALLALILTFGPISGAHLNPAVTLADAFERGIAWREVPAYLAAQCLGGVAGAATAHLMFGLRLFSFSHRARSGPAQVFSEFVATFGLLAVIWGCARLRSRAIPVAVAAYIAAAYWFTASTSFANPALAIARSLSDTFAGIRPADVLPFIAAQLFGAGAATALFRWLVPSLPQEAENILMPHASSDAESRDTKIYLFACVHNAGRSQMAAALFNQFVARGGAPRCCRAVSAGTEPAERVHPEVVAAMREIGVDLSRAKPQRLTDEMARHAALLVTMGCGEQCPAVPGVRRMDWPLPDPKGQPVETVRAIRDEIAARVREMVRTDCAAAAPRPDRQPAANSPQVDS